MGGVKRRGVRRLGVLGVQVVVLEDRVIVCLELIRVVVPEVHVGVHGSVRMVLLGWWRMQRAFVLKAHRGRFPWGP